jgi:ubiquinone/menaquinone biosynthesis C-methylase UbiE
MTTIAAVVVLVALAVVWRRRYPAPYPPRLAFLLDIPLRGLRPRPAQLARQLVLKPQMRVLEIGPGSGVFTRALVDLEPPTRLVCLDVQPAMLYGLRRRLGARTPSLVCGDAGALPFRDGSFGRILLVSVLGEVPNRDRALRECGRLLSDDGELVVAESLIDPDYISPRTLAREARDVGLVAIGRVGPWVSYTQRLARCDSTVPSAGVV